MTNFENNSNNEYIKKGEASEEESSNNDQVSEINRQKSEVDQSNVEDDCKELSAQRTNDIELELEKLKGKMREKEEYFQSILATKESELSEKQFALERLQGEMEKDRATIDLLRKELDKYKKGGQDKITKLENQVKELEYALKNAEQKVQDLEMNLISTNATIESQNRTIENLVIENKNYLEQIAKLQDVIEETEKEILQIEKEHLEKQALLEQELKRESERAGQIDSYINREKTGELARDKHIRAVMSESELGRITLYVVDYFSNTKKKFLALDTLCSELNISPIIARSHLRNLHGLNVCEFNEVSRQIRLIT